MGNETRVQRRLRISHVIVQPVLVWDDGEELTPGPEVQPISSTLSGLADLAGSLAAEIGKLEAKLADDTESEQ